MSYWTAKAACAGLDTELFFSDNRQDQEAAKAVCCRCPVLEACHADALITDQRGPHGVRAGLTAKQRRRAREVTHPTITNARREQAREATRTLTAEGLSATQIATRLGLSEATVYTWRREFRTAA